METRTRYPSTTKVSDGFGGDLPDYFTPDSCPASPCSRHSMAEVLDSAQHTGFNGPEDNLHHVEVMNSPLITQEEDCPIIQLQDPKAHSLMFILMPELCRMQTQVTLNPTLQSATVTPTTSCYASTNLDSASHTLLIKSTCTPAKDTQFGAPIHPSQNEQSTQTRAAGDKTKRVNFEGSTHSQQSPVSHGSHSRDSSREQSQENKNKKDTEDQDGTCKKAWHRDNKQSTSVHNNVTDGSSLHDVHKS